jgi:hypothetical protein
VCAESSSSSSSKNMANYHKPEGRTIQELKDIANKLRIHSVAATSASKSGYVKIFFCNISSHVNGTHVVRIGLISGCIQEAPTEIYTVRTDDHTSVFGVVPCLGVVSRRSNRRGPGARPCQSVSGLVLVELALRQAQLRVPSFSLLASFHHFFILFMSQTRP